MKKLYWPGESPVGKLIDPDGFDSAPHEIVGVARDHKVRSVGEEPRPYLHFAVAQSPSVLTTFMVRSASPPEGALPLLERELHAMDPEIVLTEIAAYAAAALILIAVALAANLMPAWKASRVSPMTALRYE